MHISNRFVIVCNIRIVIQMLKKKSIELCFLGILSSKKIFVVTIVLYLLQVTYRPFTRPLYHAITLFNV